MPSDEKGTAPDQTVHMDTSDGVDDDGNINTRGRSNKGSSTSGASDSTVTAAAGAPIAPVAHPSAQSQVGDMIQPITFPNPHIKKSYIRKVNVLNAHGMVERKTVIDSGSGNIYEIGATIKKAIFGQVIHAILLVAAPAHVAPSSDEMSLTSEAATTTATGSTASSLGSLPPAPASVAGPPGAPVSGAISAPAPAPPLLMRSDHHRAIKVYSKRILRALQGRTAENPLTEITALQFIGDAHPNLMGQIECCTDEENIYSVMRFCQGGELFDYIDGHGPMQDAQARSFFHQLMAGLQRLQELGIAHRDMSLENILFDSAANLYVIIDFGMCLRLRYDDENMCFLPIARQQVCGKKNYIAPEVIRGDDVFNPMLCDMWAAGVILFIALTGVPPVDSATATDNRFQMIAQGRLQDMVTAWGLPLDRAAVDLMQKLMNPRPLDRPTISQVLSHPWMLRGGGGGGGGGADAK